MNGLFKYRHKLHDRADYSFIYPSGKLILDI